MIIAVYRVTDGYITRFVDCPEDHISIQCQDDENYYADPPADATHIIAEKPCIVPVEPIPPTPEQVMRQIKIERNSRLSRSDWTQLPDVTLTNEQKAAWAAYRQQLRDFPAICNPANPVWPTPP